MSDTTAPKVDWDALLTVTARRGDIAAAAQSLGYANDPSDEALAFQRTLLDALEQTPASSPSTHQDSPKVPGWPSLLIAGIQVGDREKVGDNRLFGVVHETQGAMDRYKADSLETYIPVSALLSDEVVDRIAHRRYSGRPRGMVYEGVRDAVRGDLQTVIEQVGGADHA